MKRKITYKDIPDSFYEVFWNEGADHFFEWKSEVAEQDARLSKKEMDLFNPPMTYPDWNELSNASKKKLKKVIFRDWMNGVDVKNPSLIKCEYGDRYVNHYISPNSYSDLEYVSSLTIDDILLGRSTFVEGRYTLRDILKQHDKNEAEWLAKEKKNE